MVYIIFNFCTKMTDSFKSFKTIGHFLFYKYLIINEL
jgi:hypothetical protein